MLLSGSFRWPKSVFWNDHRSEHWTLVTSLLLFSCVCCTLGWPGLQTDHWEEGQLLNTDVCIWTCIGNREEPYADSLYVGFHWQSSTNHHLTEWSNLLRDDRWRKYLWYVKYYLNKLGMSCGKLLVLFGMVSKTSKGWGGGRGGMDAEPVVSWKKKYYLNDIINGHELTLILGCVIGRGNFFFIKKIRRSEKSLIYYVYIAFLSQKLYFDVV